MDHISLFEISSKLKGVNIYLNNNFLKKMLIRASNSDRPHCSLDFIKKMGLKLTTKYSCCTIYGWIKYQKTIPLEKLRIVSNLGNISQKEIERNIISLNAGRGNIKINFPIYLNEQLGSIIGHILGDGSIDKKYLQVFFSNSERALLKEFSNNMMEIFKIEPRIWMQKEPEFGNTHWDKRLSRIDQLILGRNGGLFYPTICGLILNAIFEDFAIGKNKKMTFKIMNANKNFKRGLVRAFYDDESSVGKKNIRLFQDKIEVLEAFRKILREFEINASEIKFYIKRDKQRFYLDIFKKSNFIKFRNEIGFTSPLKAKKLDELCIIKNLKNSK